MMKTAAVPRPLIAVLIASCALGFAGAARAQAQTQVPGPTPNANELGADVPRDIEPMRSELAWGAATQKITRDRRASELIGTRVRNWKGQDLGTIVDLVVDVNNARVHYAVLAYSGGYLDGGDKAFPYPVSLLRQGTGDELILNVPREALERAPGFRSTQWPDWNDRIYTEELDSYYGPTVSVQRLPNQRLRRASELIGADVADGAGRQAGEIRDIVVDISEAEVPYAVLDFAPSWGPDDAMIAMPLAAFAFPRQADEGLVLQVPRERIDLSRAFDEDQWPNFDDKAYRYGFDEVPGVGSPDARPPGVGERR